MNKDVKSRSQESHIIAHLHGSYLIVERERLYDAGDGLENLCFLEVRYSLKTRVQFAERRYMRCKGYAIVVTQVAKRIGCW